MMDSRKAVVLLSGGMDSCVSTAIARERHGAENLGLLHAGYGQRTQARERRAFEDIADFYGVRDRLVVQLDHFRAIGGSALTDKNIAVPENEFGAPGLHGSTIPVTYVPLRIAKRHVSHRNRAAMQSWCTEFIFGNRNVLVRESGPAYRAKVIKLHDESVPHAIEICNVFERAPFALLRALPVPGVQQPKILCAVPLPCNGGAN